MIWRKDCPRATPAEFARMDLIRTLGCMCCALKGDVAAQPIEVHHVIRGNKRMGHLYTIPLCAAHHRGERGEHGTKEVSVHGSGMKAFRTRWGYDDLELWQRLQVLLGEDDSLPPSKIMPRREASKSEAERSLSDV